MKKIFSFADENVETCWILLTLPAYELEKISWEIMHFFSLIEFGRRRRRGGRATGVDKVEFELRFVADQEQQQQPPADAERHVQDRYRQCCQQKYEFVRRRLAAKIHPLLRSNSRT